MSCPAFDELVRYVDGELLVNRHQQLQAHLAACPRCAANRAAIIATTQRIASSAEPAAEEAQIGAIMKRVGETPQRAARPALRQRSWMRPALAGLALAAGMLLAVLWWRPMRPAGVPTDPTDEQFVARGGATRAESWVELWVYRRGTADRYLPVGSHIASDTPLVFGYDNSRRDDRFHYLLIFAVSAAGQVFWYYPAFERADSDPASVTISAGRHELRDEIVHALPAGKLHLIALFSRQALHVSQIERAVAERRAAAPQRRLDAATLQFAQQWPTQFRGTAQITRPLTVTTRGTTAPSPPTGTAP